MDEDTVSEKWLRRRIRLVSALLLVRGIGVVNAVMLVVAVLNGAQGPGGIALLVVDVVVLVAIVACVRALRGYRAELEDDLRFVRNRKAGVGGV
jgi:hypothetical protein